MTIQQFLFYNKTIASLNTLSTNFHFIESKINQHLVKNKKLLKDTFSSWFSMIDKPQQTLHSVSSVLQIPFPGEISAHSFVSIVFTAIIEYVATYIKLKESRGNSSFCLNLSWSIRAKDFSKSALAIGFILSAELMLILKLVSVRAREEEAVNEKVNLLWVIFIVLAFQQ